ncbi:MAG TPA: choline dehydrogenase [Gammaproteobacteria bacterium]|nr:choline dehydrogenase [Gammaproteobacteria bacterium]
MSYYDYIIVGAGSAGCVLANRLSANSEIRVCLLEAGGSNRSPLLHVPAGWAATFNNPNYDWSFETEPEPELKDRQVFWPRGKSLGGSSAINGMIYVRGVPVDFAAWEQAGAKGWSWEEVLPYYKKAEHQQVHHDDMHGSDGPLHVQDVRDKRPMDDVFIHAMNQAGISSNPDFNGVDQAGCGYYQFTQNNGRRWSTASAYLTPARSRNNLTILTHAVTQRVVFEEKKACGVEILRRGKMETIQGAHVILSSGAVASPQLLEVSGVGDADRLSALGINLVHHAPDVGEHLQDHLLCKVVFGTKPEHSINREVQGLNLLPAALKWFFLRQGPLTTGSAPVGAFCHTRDGLEAPDVQIHFASGGTLYNNEGKIQAMKQPAVTAVVNQSRPESRGSIHIKSADISQAPSIAANYLSSALDRDTLLKGMRILLNIFDQSDLQPYLGDRLSPGPDVDLSSDDALMDYIRMEASTVYHPTSTCSIGKVVDANLQVMGIEGLSVIDASVMPYVVSGNTNAATIMVAEKGAEQLLAARN